MPPLEAQSARQSLLDVLGTAGTLAEHIPGFTARAEQLHMAEWVLQALESRQHLIVEAGTGVGKTFAYLVPALLAGKRIIISTGSRSLQDQLFHRDLPMLTGVMGRPVRIALLKGRANYLCEHRLSLATTQASARGLGRELATSLRKVKSWSMQTRTGDVGELAAVAETDLIWPWVTSTRDNCLGSECSVLERCHVMAARRDALAADIVVVNHHLLMADLLLKERGFGDLLPGADAVIVDEAHQLPEVATQAFGTTLSARQLLELVRDVTRERMQSPLTGISDVMMQCMQGVEEQAQLGTQVLGAMADVQDATQWPDALLDALHECRQQLQRFAQFADLQSQPQSELASLRDRALEFVARCDLFATSAEEAESVVPVVRWSTFNKSGFSLHQAPVEVARPLSASIREQGGAWVFTSATLAVGQNLQHFVQRVGLQEARTGLLGSPFDYARQALLYLPAMRDMPSSPQHTQQVLEAALPIIDASGGRAFLLFTSYRALRAAAEWLRARWGLASPYPLLVQGEAPRDVLLKVFREHGNAVLLGTGSFWEGVDVKGDALCVVVIDKLPFAVPDEPLIKARLALIEQRGGNAFMEESVPQAVVTLKQGVGRLIRDQADFGVIMLCDQRLTTRSYGKVFLDSLPPMPRTRQGTEAIDFLRRHLHAIDTVQPGVVSETT